MSYEVCPNANEACRFYNTEEGCRSNTHHAYYPRRAYRTVIEKAFRELPDNKEQLCMAEHLDKHATERPPQKPPREVMIQAIAAAAINQTEAVA